MWRSALRLRPHVAVAGASLTGVALAAGHASQFNILPVAHAADDRGKTGGVGGYFVIGLPVVAVVGIGAFVVTQFYKTCPPSSLMVVYGAGRPMKIVKGGGSVVIPGIQQMKMMYLPSPPPTPHPLLVLGQLDATSCIL